MKLQLLRLLFLGLFISLFVNKSKVIASIHDEQNIFFAKPDSLRNLKKVDINVLNNLSWKNYLAQAKPIYFGIQKRAIILDSIPEFNATKNGGFLKNKYKENYDTALNQDFNGGNSKLRKLEVLVQSSPLDTSRLSNWFKDTTNLYNFSAENRMWRSGDVAISPRYKFPNASKLQVLDDYNRRFNRAAYFSLNEPVWNYKNDTTKIKVEEDTTTSHTTVVINQYANYKEGKRFRDVHNSALEVNMFRGIRDSLGFQDGGNLDKNATVKLSATFNNNGRAYQNTEFDIINLRLFTGSTANNTAIINNFYALRLEDFRGLNPQIIQNGWGIYMKPALLKNYFGGAVGIGTDNISHKLTIEATSNPLKITGLAQVDTVQAKSVLAVDASGSVNKIGIRDLMPIFPSTVDSLKVRQRIGVGTNNLSHAVNIVATEKPLRIEGLSKVDTIQNKDVLSIGTDGSVNKLNLTSLLRNKNAEVLHISKEMVIGDSNLAVSPYILSINATEKPLKIKGLAVQDTSTAKEVLSINQDGEVSKVAFSSFAQKTINPVYTFSTHTQDTVLVISEKEVFIHKGAEAYYVLPDPASCPGKAWRIINVGTGSITLNYFFKDGSDQRKSIVPSPGASKFMIMSDGTEYIAID
jgi:hypothetical protein